MNLNEENLQLKNLVSELQKENQRLKKLLNSNRISYIQNQEQQNSNVIYPTVITEELARRFFTMFWGRTDVYCKRYVNRNTGKSGYFTQCNNFWSNVCPKRFHQKTKCSDCEHRSWKKLGKKQILEHLQGNAENESDVVAVYPLLSDDTCRFLVFDFDNHSKGAEALDYANTDNEWMQEVDTLRTICSKNGIDALVERSRSGKGAHLWIFFEKAVPAKKARKFGDVLLQKGTESVNMTSFKYYDRMLPMQDTVSGGTLGNAIALPLQGKALQNGNSTFVDERWQPYDNQWEILFSKSKLTDAFIDDFIKVYRAEHAEGTDKVNRAEPWKKENSFRKEDITEEMRIMLADAIYIERANLEPRLQNQIRKLAAFGNPVFYKNQAIGFSNFDNSRFIYLGSDEEGYIRIPRGLKETLLRKCNEADIEYIINDQRSEGNSINLSFIGKLKESQKPAVEKMLEFETGILSAATAFGKTVVCTNLIAEKKTSTLILLESSSLIEQWENALNQFLHIEEEPPEYQTPSGRIKQRKSVLGRIQGAHDSSTGIIDIAMVGSLKKKGEFHRRLKDYGMVIVDECHHAASQTIVNVLQEVQAKYVYGVTATPIRGDGLEKINEMILGPIRYMYTAKDRAKEQGIEHLVYPRFTRTVVTHIQKERMHPNEAYALIRDNSERDDLIIGDIKHCIELGRTPVILSKYKDHSERLYEGLKDLADNVFLLTGNNSKKEHKTILEQMNSVPAKETLILIATGQLIGEGFDYPRLDTLMMATPVSGKHVVEQYAGRLNRDYEGKKNVIVYDYIDWHVPLLANMYNKRLRAYKKIGYDVCNDIVSEKQSINAIFDIENYKDVYKKDLLTAQKEIIISSPSVSKKKVEEMISLLKEQQEKGIRVIIVSWNPDDYKYGDPSLCYQLHEWLRESGFEVKYADDTCERYAIIDREIVWYGSMNFLGKEDIEDNLMRLNNKQIAAELLEMTFTK